MPFIGESISKAKVEFSFIDVTARHIIKLARSNAIPIIYHVYAPCSITMKQVIDNAKGSEMTVVSDSEFEQKLHELGMHELIGLNSNGDNQISGVTDSNMTQTVMKELQGSGHIFLTNGCSSGTIYCLKNLMPTRGESCICM